MDTIGTIKTTPPSVSAACRWFIPGMQDVASGVPVDKSGNARNLSIGASTTDAAIWANAGFITATQATASDKGVAETAGRLAWDGSQGQSLLLAFQVKGSAPAAQARGIGDRSSGNGLAFDISTGGLAQLALRDGITSYTSGFGSVVLFDGAAHTVVLYIDGIGKTATCWVDGTILSQLSAANVAGSLVGTTVSAAAFGYGHDGAPAGSYTLGSQWRNMHAYVKAGAISNAAALAARLTRDPFKPLSTTEL